MPRAEGAERATFWQLTPGIVGVLRKQHNTTSPGIRAGREDDTTLLARGTPQGLIGLTSRGHLNSNGEVRAQAQGKPHRGDLTDLTSCGQLQYNFYFYFCFEEGGL